MFCIVKRVTDLSQCETTFVSRKSGKILQCEILETLEKKRHSIQIRAIRMRTIECQAKSLLRRGKVFSSHSTFESPPLFESL